MPPTKTRSSGLLAFASKLIAARWYTQILACVCALAVVALPLFAIYWLRDDKESLKQVSQAISYVCVFVIARASASREKPLPIEPDIK